MSIAGVIAGFAQPVIRPFFGGIGCILCLHRIIPEAECSRLGDNRAIELTPDALRTALRWLIARGMEPVALDAVPERLAKRGRRKFFAVTLDDGYRDNLTHALPVFRESGVPFTVTITTGLLNGAASAWWYWLEDVLHSRESLAVGGSEFPLTTKAERERAFAELAKLIRAGDSAHRATALASIAGAAGRQSALAAVPMLTWDEARTLAADPLVTIGCHTVTHPVLSRLDENAARQEVVESRREIEERLGVIVRHLAYPFGGANAVGAREFQLAAKCGFTTAMTTRNANLFPAHAAHSHALPRLSLSGNYPVVKRLAALESGLVALREFRGKRVVTE